MVSVYLFYFMNRDRVFDKVETGILLFLFCSNWLYPCYLKVTYEGFIFFRINPCILSMFVWIASFYLRVFVTDWVSSVHIAHSKLRNGWETTIPFLSPWTTMLQSWIHFLLWTNGIHRSLLKGWSTNTRICWFNRYL